jgi:hypothetical protein
MTVVIASLAAPSVPVIRVAVPVELALAQRTLDVHAVSMVDGLCLGCRRPLPCGVRDAAAAVFVRYHRLPRRRPGASRPELLGARRIGLPALLPRAGSVGRS